LERLAERGGQVRGLIVILLMTAYASAQEVEVRVTRSGDGTVVIPAGEGDVTITVRTAGASTARRLPRDGVRIDEKKLEDFVRDRSKVKDEWT